MKAVFLTIFLSLLSTSSYPVIIGGEIYETIVNDKFTYCSAAYPASDMEEARDELMSSISPDGENVRIVKKYVLMESRQLMDTYFVFKKSKMGDIEYMVTGGKLKACIKFNY